MNFKATGPVFAALFLMLNIASATLAAEDTFHSLNADKAGLAMMEGEIRNISEQAVEINAAGEERRLLIGEWTVVLMNGRPAAWRTLRPVADNAYFIGRIWFDRTGTARIIEGDYHGVSVRLMNITPSNGGYRLTTVNTEEDGEPHHQYETALNCRGIKEALAAAGMDEAYLLFDFQGKVRGIYF